MREKKTVTEKKVVFFSFAEAGCQQIIPGQVFKEQAVCYGYMLQYGLVLLENAVLNG